MADNDMSFRQRAVIEFLVKEEIPAAEIHQRLQRAYGSNMEKCDRARQATGKCKVKAVPLQARSGPEGSRKLRFPDFMTTAQDVGKVVSLTHRPLLPTGNAPGTHFC